MALEFDALVLEAFGIDPAGCSVAMRGDRVGLRAPEARSELLSAVGREELVTFTPPFRGASTRTFAVRILAARLDDGVIIVTFGFERR